jgi:hypothetical protein
MAPVACLYRVSDVVVAAVDFGGTDQRFYVGGRVVEKHVYDGRPFRRLLSILLNITCIENSICDNLCI